jgi:hypothetical protein
MKKPTVPEGFEQVTQGLLRSGDLMWIPAAGRWRVYDVKTFLRRWRAEECHFVIRKIK